MKQNYIYIIAISLVAIFAGETAYRYLNNYQLHGETYAAFHSESYPLCVDDSNYYLENQETCNSLILHNENKTDSYNYFYMIIREANWYFPFFIVLVVAIPGIYSFHYKTKSGFFKNVLVRQNYGAFFHKEYLSSLKASFIVPFVLGVLFLCCSYLSNWNFDAKATLMLSDGDAIYSNHVEYIDLFTLVFFINIWLHCIFCLNIGYIIDKKSKNFLITSIGILLAFFICQIFTEIFGGLVINNLLGLDQLYHSMILTSIWSYEGIDNLSIMVLVNLFLVLVTFILLLKMYNKKEKVIIANE